MPIGQALRTGFTLLLLWLTLGLAQAQTVLPVPPLTGHVIDTTGTLSGEQRAALDAKLTALEHDKGSQVVVLMVPSTQPEDIAAYANRVGNIWKIGRKAVGDGLLIVVAKDDHRVRIEVAKTLEGAVPDIAASHIIDNAMVPFFRHGDYAAGLSAGIDQVAARIRGEPLPPVATPNHTGATNGVDWVNVLVFLFIAFPVASALARSLFGQRLGAVVTGVGVGGLALLISASLLLAIVAALFGFAFALFSGALTRSGLVGSGPVFLPGGGRWGDGFGGGRGGFSSGGGGDFGGGGASGSW